MNKIFNPCCAIIKKGSAGNKNIPAVEPITCGQESNHLHTPGTKDDKRYCEFHYNYLKDLVTNENK